MTVTTVDSMMIELVRTYAIGQYKLYCALLNVVDKPWFVVLALADDVRDAVAELPTKEMMTMDEANEMDAEMPKARLEHQTTADLGMHLFHALTLVIGNLYVKLAKQVRDNNTEESYAAYLLGFGDTAHDREAEKIFKAAPDAVQQAFVRAATEAARDGDSPKFRAAMVRARADVFRGVLRSAGAAHDSTASAPSSMTRFISKMRDSLPTVGSRAKTGTDMGEAGRDVEYDIRTDLKLAARLVKERECKETVDFLNHATISLQELKHLEERHFAKETSEDMLKQLRNFLQVEMQWYRDAAQIAVSYDKEKKGSDDS